MLKRTVRTLAGVTSAWAILFVFIGVTFLLNVTVAQGFTG